MYAHDFELWGVRLGVWNALVVAGIGLGYLVLRATARARGLPRRGLALRWLGTAYVALLGAQLFSYAFDRDTTLLPPPGMSAVRYYLHPLAGGKTLFGAMLTLPLGVGLVMLPARAGRFGDALAAWTPPLCAALACVRVGCFLQGCCYGIPSTWLGVALPPRSLLYWEHRRAGLIDEGEWTHPVVPTQLLEAAGLALLAGWAYRRARQGGEPVFLPTLVAYAALRFALEFARADPVRNAFGPFSSSQWIALAVGAAAWTTRAYARRARPAP